MTYASIRRCFAPIKRHLPGWLADPIRRVGTALLTPLRFSYRSGHFVSSLRQIAVARGGSPLPWYTYPCIELLSNRNYEGMSILEFGAGQSTLWWAGRASRVVSFEGDRAWHANLAKSKPVNVELHLVSMQSPEECVASVAEALRKIDTTRYDVVVIDGLYRYEMIDIALKYVSDEGVIICDDAEGYDFFDGFRESGLGRVDFFGYAPGVVLPHCTSVFFKPNSFLFSAKHKIPVIASQV